MRRSDLKLILAVIVVGTFTWLAMRVSTLTTENKRLERACPQFRKSN